MRRKRELVLDLICEVDLAENTLTFYFLNGEALPGGGLKVAQVVVKSYRTLPEPGADRAPAADGRDTLSRRRF